MKKITALLAALIMTLSLAACASSTNEASKAKTEENSETSYTITNEAIVDEASKAKTGGKSETAYTIANEVIVDNEYCKVTLASGTATKTGGADFKFTLENKTADTEMMFSMDDTAVNGWLITSLFAESVSAGKIANETLRFSSSDLEDCGLSSVDKLAFSLRVYDNSDWLADNFVDDTFTIYPTGLTEAEVVSPERRIGNDEMIVVDNDTCSFIIMETYVDKIWGYTVVAYLENKTADTSLMFSWDDVSVNGYMIDPFWASSISAGNKKIATINFSSSDFEENDIEAVNEIEFELRVYNYDDWSASDFVKDTFSYQPAQ